MSAAYADLSRIRVLFRQPDTLTLWGIPYEMRPGQQPGDLWRGRRVEDFAAAARGVHGASRVEPGPREDWIYLGEPGWWGTRDEFDRLAAAAFVARCRDAHVVPGGPYEWDVIPPALFSPSKDESHELI